MSKCVFAGCFDPFTIGHLDVVKRLSAIFEEVFVVVSKNAGKNLWQTETKGLQWLRRRWISATSK